MFLKIIHLCSYVLALIPATFVAMSVDYQKIIKAKSNLYYYLAAFAVGSSLTFLMGEFLYHIITMFIE